MAGPRGRARSHRRPLARAQPRPVLPATTTLLRAAARTQPRPNGARGQITGGQCLLPAPRLPSSPAAGVVGRDCQTHCRLRLVTRPHQPRPAGTTWRTAARMAARVVVRLHPSEGLRIRKVADTSGHDMWRRGSERASTSAAFLQERLPLGVHTRAVQSLRTPIPARPPAPRPLGRCKVCVRPFQRAPRPSRPLALCKVSVRPFQRRAAASPLGLWRCKGEV